MSPITIIILILLILLLVGSVPTWPYATWGYGPPGIVFVLIVVLLILAISGRI
jgi:hypothetical protein